MDNDATLQWAIFLNIYRRLADGNLISPRGQLVREVENFSYQLPPYVRFANFESRKLNLDYIKTEFLWYLEGDPCDLSICKHAKIWRNLVNTNRTINSNYGQYIFGEGNQFNNVISILKDDKDSRRASIMILNSHHLVMETNDVPCTYALNFRIRNNKLNMSVHMRSQDAIFGLGNDAPAFSFVHEMMLHTLRRYYQNLEYGLYFHTADSFHVYKRHFKMLNKILDDDPYCEVLCPRISGADEVDFLQRLEFSSIPSKFEFTNWLVTKEKNLRTP